MGSDSLERLKEGSDACGGYAGKPEMSMKCGPFTQSIIYIQLPKKSSGQYFLCTPYVFVKACLP